MTKTLTIMPRGGVSEPARITTAVPGAPTGGYVESALSKWRYDYTTRAVNSLTKLNHAEAALFEAQAEVVNSTIKKREALFRLQEQPEVLGHQLAVRRVERAEALRQVQHRFEMSEMRYAKERTVAETELTHARATLTHARTVLTDAEQQLSAQRKHGELNYELLHAKKNLELLDVHLSAKERRALMRNQLREIEDEESERWPVEDEIDEMLRRAPKAK